MPSNTPPGSAGPFPGSAVRGGRDSALGRPAAVEEDGDQADLAKQRARRHIDHGRTLTLTALDRSLDA
ncbi:hypothetical protein [Streptomyces viridosporus]|uniref:hypothetical protein n=1 Tax=Streptomyces viridosporus TaxID=67581 RepID=UPI00117D1A41|nr:hypothetical protein [Streptomyces viridosporus]